MQNNQFNSRSADKFVVRLPEGMRKQIAELSLANSASMNSEMIRALEAHLDCQAQQKLLLDSIRAQAAQARNSAYSQTRTTGQDSATPTI